MKRKILLLAIIPFLATGCVTSGGHATNDPDASRFNTRLALEYFQRGQRELAMEKINKAIEQDSSSAEAHMIKGMLLAELEEFDAADDHFEEALDLAPDSPTVQNNYGSFLCQRGEYEDGTELFLQVARNQRYGRPDAAWANAGVCSKLAGNTAAAENYFRKALDVNGTNSTALWNMADISFRNGAYLGARAFLQRLEASQRLPPEAIWLGIRTERRLGDPQAEKRYTDILLRDYPDSREAARVMEEGRER